MYIPKRESSIWIVEQTQKHYIYKCTHDANAMCFECGNADRNIKEKEIKNGYGILRFLPCGWGLAPGAALTLL